MAARAALPIPISECSIFLCPNNGTWLPVFGNFNIGTADDVCDCTQGCTDTVKEPALEADSGRKIPCRTGDSNPRRYCTRTLYPLSYTRPTLGVRGAALRLGGRGGEVGGGGGRDDEQTEMAPGLVRGGISIKHKAGIISPASLITNRIPGWPKKQPRQPKARANILQATKNNIKQNSVFANLSTNVSVHVLPQRPFSQRFLCLKKLKKSVLLQLEAAAMFYAVQTEPRVDCLLKIAD